MLVTEISADTVYTVDVAEFKELGITSSNHMFCFLSFQSVDSTYIWLYGKYRRSSRIRTRSHSSTRREIQTGENLPYVALSVRQDEEMGDVDDDGRLQWALNGSIIKPY